MPIAASPFDGLPDPHGTEPRQQFLVQHPQLQPGQIGTQAVVRTLTKT
jgi:hypothetical protein